MISDLNISTLVYMLETNIKIIPEKLDTIFQKVNIINYNSPIEGIIRLGVRGKIKGICKKAMFRRSESKVNQVKNFRNQVSIYVRILDYIEIKLKKSLYDKNTGFFPKIIKTKNIELDKENIYEFKKGQTAFQFNEIKIVIGKDKSNLGKRIKLFTSVIRKSQEKQLIFIDHELVENDIKNGYILFPFIEGCYAHILYIEKEMDLDIKVSINFMVEVNMFLFTSGKIKIAGCTKECQINQSVDSLITYLSNNLNENEMKDYFGITKEEFIISNKNEVMINSDFTNHYPIKRFELNELIHNKFNLLSSYEQITHPAVIIKYYHNLAFPQINGKCQCQSMYNVRHCNGRGNGNGPSQCKSVTILVFQSGKVILTGGRNMTQVENAYHFIKDLLDNHELLLKNTVDVIDKNITD
tara:strand:+ start:383 stop:1615 length:1233 start_codon:yes stop_codon:yes gene_type:complete